MAIKDDGDRFRFVAEHIGHERATMLKKSPKENAIDNFYYLIMNTLFYCPYTSVNKDIQLESDIKDHITDYVEDNETYEIISHDIVKVIGTNFVRLSISKKSRPNMSKILSLYRTKSGKIERFDLYKVYYEVGIRSVLDLVRYYEKFID